MIKIFIDEDYPDYCGVKIGGDDFKHCLKIIKKVDVRKFSKIKKQWFVPVIYVKQLINLARDADIEYELHPDVKIKQKEIVKRIKKSIQIKSYDYNRKISEFNNLKLDLHPFQTLGAYYLYNIERAILGDMVGLGKTAQSLSSVEMLFRKNKINFNIVLCPSRLKFNWANEIEKFTNRSYIVVEGDKSKRKGAYKKAWKYDNLIVSYSSITNDAHLIKQFILDRGFRFSLVIDEVQYAKNATSKRTQECIKLSSYATHVFGLSATIYENHILEVYNVFISVNPTIFGARGSDKEYFINKYCTIGFWGEVQNLKKNMVKPFQKRLMPFVARRFKEDVLDQLPDKIHTDLWVELSKKQREFYNTLQKLFKEEMEGGERFNALTTLAYLRQATLSSKLIDPDGENISTKLDTLIEFLQTLHKDTKIVVFCHFKLMVWLIYEEIINKLNWKTLWIHGGKKDETKDIVDEFENNENIKALITSDILKEGVNLPSADYLINFDLLYNPAQMMQREGRICRLHSKHSVLNIVNIIAKDTVEERMFSILKEKEKTARTLIDFGRTEDRVTLKTIKGWM